MMASWLVRTGAPAHSRISNCSRFTLRSSSPSPLSPDLPEDVPCGYSAERGPHRFDWHVRGRVESNATGDSVMGAYDCLRAGNRIGNLQLATIPPCLLNLWMIRRQNPTRGYSSCARLSII